jgi:hypothetical protein
MMICKGWKIDDDKHIMIFLHVCEHLDFGLKNGVKTKFVCLRPHVILCIYDNHCCSYGIRPH